jgi:hypothetical protein
MERAEQADFKRRAQMTSDEVQSQALRALSEFDAAPLFSKCGASIESPGVNTIQVQNWESVLESIRTVEWENAGIDTANLLRHQIRTHDPVQLNLWNDRVVDIKPQLEEVVYRKLTPWMQSRTLPPKVVNVVRWDLLHLCMYEGHKPYVSVPFYDEMRAWYLAGHLPCGWQGDFPAGQMMVY